MHENLSRIITESTERLVNELEHITPNMAGPVADWMRSLAGGLAPEAYFKHPLAFPTLLLPWWMEQSFGLQPNLDFHADIAYSSINGYYFIRMIDNVMDDDSEVEKKLLPALAFFHTEFQTAYGKYFPPVHPFWELYRSVWFGTAQAVVGDAQLSVIDLSAFEKLSAQKVSAAMIPVAAICHFHQRLDAQPKWFEFVACIGRWHQMFNDVFDWYKDSQSESQTYFLSEASRLKKEDETEMMWIACEGFAYGCDILRGWMKEAQELANELNCAPMVAYLEERSTLFEERANASEQGFDALRKLAGIKA